MIPLVSKFDSFRFADCHDRSVWQGGSMSDSGSQSMAEHGMDRTCTHGSNHEVPDGSVAKER